MDWRLTFCNLNMILLCMAANTIIDCLKVAHYLIVDTWGTEKRFFILPLTFFHLNLGNIWGFERIEALLIIRFHFGFELNYICCETKRVKLIRINHLNCLCLKVDKGYVQIYLIRKYWDFRHVSSYERVKGKLIFVNNPNRFENDQSKSCEYKDKANNSTNKCFLGLATIPKKLGRAWVLIKILNLMNDLTHW